MKNVLSRLAMIAAAVLPYSPVAGQGSVVQNGPVTSGHVAAWWQNGQIYDGGAIPLPNTANTWTAKQTFGPGTTNAAPINILPGVAPSNAINGDIWTTTSGLWGRFNGVSAGPFAAVNQPNSWTALQTFSAPTTSSASINLPAGVAPTSPNDGDVWATSSGMFARVNGSTIQFAPLTASQIPFSQTPSATAGTVAAKLQQVVSVTDAPYNADPTGATDSTAAFQAAEAASLYVYVPAGTYKLSSTITLRPYGQIIGAGPTNTILTETTDSVAFVTQAYSQLRQLQVGKSGSHTKDLIEVGSVSLDGGRTVISDVTVSGAGQDGIALINGNLGTLQNISSFSNGRDGIRFTAQTNDHNAWTLQGYIDLRANARDGLNFTAGSSPGDPLAPRSNSGNLIVTQNNGRYGVYVGTRSNNLVVYSEANTTADIFLDTYAYGNDVTILEGGVITDHGSANLLTTHNADADYKRQFVGNVLFDGTYGTGGLTINNNATVGKLHLFHSGAAQSKMEFDGSGADQALTFENVAVDGGGNKQWEINAVLKGDLNVARQVNETHGTCVVQARAYLGSGNKFIAYGTGDPTGQLTGDPGSQFNSDLGMYFKAAGSGGGSAGWVKVA